jgi:Iron-containing redox enzyme
MDHGLIRAMVEGLFAEQVESLVSSGEFQALESGRAAPDQYDAFIENLARAHLRSPQLLAFLFSLAPPGAAGNLQHNLIEELGLEEASGRAHPDLLRELMVAAGLGGRIAVVEARADGDLRRIVVEPLLYGTLCEVGFAALTEIVAFEYMLSRIAGRFARALAEHRALPKRALEWFTHHAEVDVRHAEHGLANLEAYARYYELAPNEALTIVEMTLRENVFTRRYFRDFVATSVGRGAR